MGWALVAAATLAAVFCVVVGVVAVELSADTVTTIAVVLAVAIIVTRPLRVRSLTKMEMANKLALVPAADGYPVGPEDVAVSPGQEPQATRDLAVRYQRGGIMGLLGLLFGMGCLFLAYGLLTTTTATTERWLPGFFGALLIALTAVTAVQAVRWGVRRPILALDADGVHMPRYGYTLPWAELAEVRLIPLRAPGLRRRRPIMIVAFVPADPEAALRGLRAKAGSSRFEKSRRLYGTPLTIPDWMMDQAADQIAAAASAFAAVPVRRY